MLARLRQQTGRRIVAAVWRI